MSAAVGAFLTSSSLPGREVVVGEGDGGVAEHGVDAGRLVLLGALFAGRVLLFAQHRDRRVAARPASAPPGRSAGVRCPGVDAAAAAAAANRASRQSSASRREPQERDGVTGPSPGQRTSVRRRRAPARSRAPRPALRLCRSASRPGRRRRRPPSPRRRRRRRSGSPARSRGGCPRPPCRPRR